MFVICRTKPLLRTVILQFVLRIESANAMIAHMLFAHLCVDLNCDDRNRKTRHGMFTINGIHNYYYYKFR